jgi:hypothetical protein
MINQDNNDLVPDVTMNKVYGIPNINGSELFYGSWHLLNEALTCFTNKEYFACLLCLSTSIELWLRRSLKSDHEFYKLLRDAKEANLINEQEFNALDQLRDDRNAYVHFDLTKLPLFTDQMKTTPMEANSTPEEKEKALERFGNNVDVYPTEAHKDILPLSFVAVSAYFHLNTVAKFYRKRYPESQRYTYLLITLNSIKGLDESKVIFHLPNREKKTDTKSH